jgi:hypothetical protein
MITARATWKEKQQFTGIAGSGHEIMVDGDSHAGSSPTELVLIALCGCTGYDVASILRKKTRAVHEPRSQRGRRPCDLPAHGFYRDPFALLCGRRCDTQGCGGCRQTVEGEVLFGFRHARKDRQD